MQNALLYAALAPVLALLCLMAALIMPLAEVVRGFLRLVVFFAALGARMALPSLFGGGTLPRF